MPCCRGRVSQFHEQCSRRKVLLGLVVHARGQQEQMYSGKHIRVEYGLLSSAKAVPRSFSPLPDFNCSLGGSSRACILFCMDGHTQTVDWTRQATLPYIYLT